MSSALEQDLAYEAQDVRPVIEGWVLRYATFIATFLITVSCGSLYAAVKANMRDVRVYAVTEKGDTFQLEFYLSSSAGQAAAVVRDKSAAPATTKLMSHVRPPL